MLQHLTVIDLTTDLGALAGRMLAELGATVIKVEPETGDPLRADAAAFAAWNHGKQSLIAALDSDSYRDCLQRADILLRYRHQPSPPSDFTTLIDVVIGGFMPEGDRGERPFSDFTLMARSGLMTIIGDPDRPPLTLPGEQAFALGAIQAVSGALTALHARAASGRGQRVDVSAYQAAVLANYREPLTWQWTGRVGNRTGNLLVRGKSGVRQVWPCADGFVTWALVDNPPMMRAMVKLMAEHAETLTEVDWDNLLVADVPRETLQQWEDIVERFFALHSRQQLGSWSSQLGLGLSWIETPDDVLSSEHSKARALWVDVDDRQLPGPLWISTATVTGQHRHVPALGEHTQERSGADQ